MPSSWDVYYAFFLSALLALGIPLGLALFSRLIPANKERPVTIGAPKKINSLGTHHTVLGQRINVRFSLGINSALVLIALMLILVPCAATIHVKSGNSSVFKGLIAIVTIAAFSALGLLYSVRKGDLSWTRTLPKGKIME